MLENVWNKPIPTIGKNHLPSSPYTTVIGIQLQLTLGQHGFELFWSTHMWILVNTYISIQSGWLNPQTRSVNTEGPVKLYMDFHLRKYPKPLQCLKVNYNPTLWNLAPTWLKTIGFPSLFRANQWAKWNKLTCGSAFPVIFQGWKHVLA